MTTPQQPPQPSSADPQRSIPGAADWDGTPQPGATTGQPAGQYGREWSPAPALEPPYGWGGSADSPHADGLGQPSAQLPGDAQWSAPADVSPTVARRTRRSRRWAPILGAGVLAVGIGGYALGAAGAAPDAATSLAPQSTSQQSTTTDSTDNDGWTLPPQLQELLESLGLADGPDTSDPGTAPQPTAPDGSSESDGWGQTSPNQPGQGSNGFDPWGLLPGGGSQPGRAGGESSTHESLSSTAQAAVEKVTPAVVNIVTTVDYGVGQAAGTGIVLSADGQVLTNHHVIEGSTTIKATVVGTGQTYTATVLGSDATHDVALLQLQGANGLPVADLGDSGALQVGDLIVGVGNAGGDGGAPTSVEGRVTALEQTITASDADGSSAQTLTGLIEVDANIQSGQSGGPLINANGEVVGINTAASATNGPGSFAATGYAIPIDDAVAIVQAIARGEESGTIRTGQSPFLGVQIAQAGASGGQGVTISGVVDGSAAQRAGLAAGDTIVSVNGAQVRTADQLTSIIQGHEVGDQVRVDWLGTDGTERSATVTLGAGPAA